MMEDYTPTTKEVRKHYTYVQPGSARAERDFHYAPRDRDAEFDRWLRKHDAEVAANAVNVFEDLYFGPGLGQTREWVARCARERLGLPPRLTND